MEIKRWSGSLKGSFIKRAKGEKRRIVFNLKKRLCEFCGLDYKPTNNRQKFCINCRKAIYKSYAVRYNYPPTPRKIKVKGKPLYCQLCGKVITAPKKYRYCTNKCARKALYLKKYEYKLQSMLNNGEKLNKVDTLLWKKIQHVFYRR